MISKEDITKLEKAELHAHLNGSIPTHVLREIAKENNLLTPLEMDLLSKTPQGWEQCFSLFGLVYKLVKGNQLYYRITQEAILDFARQGVTYLELRSTLKCDPENGVTWKNYMETLFRATEDLQQTAYPDLYLPHVNWIISVDRSKGRAAAQDAVNLAIELKKSYPCLVGIDFCGDPFIDHFQNYIDIFEKARDAGLKTTFHFAEIPRTDDLNTILDFNPDRIGHACCLPEGMFERIIAEKIPVEICFSSNLATEVVSNDYEHTVIDFIKASHPTIICSDDFGIFHSDINDEYLKIAQLMNLNLSQVKVLCQESFEHAWSPFHCNQAAGRI